jgi:putative hemolysin
MIYLINLSCLISAGFFAGLETGLLSADRLRLYAKKEEGVLYARATEFLLNKPERLLGTTLIGTNTSVVTASILLTNYLRGLGLDWAPWVGSLILSLVFLLLSEIVPKSFFRQYANTVCVRLAPVLLIFYYVFLPLSLVLNGIVGTLLFLVGQHRSPKGKMPESREDFRLLVRLSSRESGLTYSDYKIFEDIFDFSDTMAREVMSPFHAYPVCHVNSAPEDLVRRALRNNVRYMPIYENRTDNVTGFVDIQDLLRTRPAAIKEILREPIFYPDTKSAPELLLEMNRRRFGLVFLVDEYGAIAGLVTPQDIASEIIGSIPGRKHLEEEDVHRLSEASFIVSGTTDLEDLYHEAGIRIRKGSYETVGGFLSTRLGRIPAPGTEYREGGILYRIEESESRQIKSVEIVKEGTRPS